MDLELLLDLQILCQIKVFCSILRGFTWLGRGHHWSTQEQKEHVQVDHVDHIYVLDSTFTWLGSWEFGFLRTLSSFGSCCQGVFNLVLLEKFDTLEIARHL